MFNCYDTVYQLITDFLFGGSVVAGSNQELIALALAAAGTVAVFWLPIRVVINVIDRITGR